jgi:hypothetical protein
MRQDLGPVYRFHGEKKGALKALVYHADFETPPQQAIETIFSSVRPQHERF